MSWFDYVSSVFIVVLLLVFFDLLTYATRMRVELKDKYGVIWDKHEKKFVPAPHKGEGGE